VLSQKPTTILAFLFQPGLAGMSHKFISASDLDYQLSFKTFSL